MSLMIVKRQQLPLVGQRIRELRKDRSLTQAGLASKIGIQQSDLCRMETGEYKVSLEALFKILKIFEMNIAEFFHLSAATDLTPSEQELLTIYRALSPSAKVQVRDFIYFTGSRSRRTRRTARHARK
jgi:transcriptional regulator with XRE-family HTH domain